MEKVKTFKQQQKIDNKLVEDLAKEFSQKELARIVVRERKKKNKYLAELKSIEESGKVNIVDDMEMLKIIEEGCIVINKPCDNKTCKAREVCKLHYNQVE